MTTFAQYLEPDFAVTAPNYLPSGGTHKGAAFFSGAILPKPSSILPNLPEVFDFSRFTYESVTAEDNRVAAIIDMGVTGTDRVIKILDLWTLRNVKAVSLWVAYFEPQRDIEITRGLTL